MGQRTLKLIAVGILVMLVTSLAAMPVAAADIRGGERVTVAANEAVDGDLYAAGTSVVIDGVVSGDVFAAGEVIIINGTVKGGVTLAGRTITISGSVGNGARLVGQTVMVKGSIGRDIVSAASDFNSTATVGGDVVVGGGNVRIAGSVGGFIKSEASNLEIAGSVVKGADVKAERLTVSPSASIQGDLIYTSEKRADIQSGAKVGGVTTHKLPEDTQKSVFDEVVSTISSKAIAFLMIFVIGLAVVFLAPAKAMSLAGAIRTEPARSAAWGAALLFGLPVAAVIVCFTFIGLPVGLIALALWGMAIYLVQIPVGLLVGQLVMRRDLSTMPRSRRLGAMAAGLGILIVLGALPYVGFWVGLAGVLFGMGALMVVMVVKKTA